MKDIHKELINEVPEERIAPEGSWDMHEILGKTLLGDKAFASVQEKSDVPKIPEKMIFKKTREYDTDLVRSLDNLEYIYKEKDNFSEVLDIIDYILTQYKNLLTRGDYIDLIIKKSFALYRLGKNGSSYQELQQIGIYAKYFTNDQRDDFYIISGNVLFTLWDKEQNPYFLPPALECFDYVIKSANENHQFDMELYRDIQYKRAHIMCYLMQDEAAIPILQEIIAMPIELDDIKINSMYLLGTAFISLERYQEAIDIFNEYLQYKPDDIKIKKYVRTLSEQLPE